jgi:hypothetical protein
MIDERADKNTPAAARSRRRSGVEHWLAETQWFANLTHSDGLANDQSFEAL